MKTNDFKMKLKKLKFDWQNQTVLKDTMSSLPINFAISFVMNEFPAGWFVRRQEIKLYGQS